VVEPSRAGLVASSPPDPVQVMGFGLGMACDEVEQAFDLGDGQGDQAGIVGWLGVGGGRQDRGGGADSGLGGGDRADGERSVVEGQLTGAQVFTDQEPGPRCAGPPWRRENGAALVRNADRTVMPPELVDQDGVGDHRQELSIVAVSTRVRLLSPVVPPDGRVSEAGQSSGEGFRGTVA
jgi:hypothetical protein